LAVGFGGAVAAYVFFTGPLPRELPQAQTTLLTDVNGQPLAALSNGQNRVDVSLREVPPVLADAVVATEDRGFFHHGGVDPGGIVRALWADLRGRELQGGSTITQQYVKNAFLSPRRTVGRKLREAVLAVRLERRYSKHQILERYLNTIYFGRGAYGVQAASRAYFGHDVGTVDLNEAAFLAGIIRSPDLGDPYRTPVVATDRRNAALDALVRAHDLSRATATAARRVPVTAFVRPSAAAADPSIRLADKGAGYFVAFVTDELVRRFGAAATFGGGLRVRTTLDEPLQSEAYDAIYDPTRGVLPLAGDPSGALVALDGSGRVRAMVGGRDYATSKVNLAIGQAGGGTGRQAGSTMKPILLAEILREGYSALSQFPAPAELVVPGADNGRDWTVRNFDGESFPGEISLVDATRNSVNTVYAQAVTAVGPARLVEMAHDLGITTPLPANPSLVLGTSDVSLLDMAAVYSTLMNRGVRVPPHVIDEVSTADGAALYRAPAGGQRVLPEPVADEVTYCLQQVVLSGTGTAAKSGRPIAGKTGTTESNTDAWFIGYSPTLTAAVWVGYRDSAQPLVNVHGVPKVNGGTLPAEIFHRFMTAALAGQPVRDFPLVTSLPGRPLPQPPVTVVTTTTSAPSTTTTSTVPLAPTSTTAVGRSSASTTTARASPGR
jgi:penicillin-binding protein 1A